MRILWLQLTRIGIEARLLPPSILIEMAWCYNCIGTRGSYVQLSPPLEMAWCFNCRHWLAFEHIVLLLVSFVMWIPISQSYRYTSSALNFVFATCVWQLFDWNPGLLNLNFQSISFVFLDSCDPFLLPAQPFHNWVSALQQVLSPKKNKPKSNQIRKMTDKWCM